VGSRITEIQRSMSWPTGPTVYALVIRQQGAALYWGMHGGWTERLDYARRWTNYHDIAAVARANNWPPAEMVWLGHKDRVLQVRPAVW
jgi:hypothetical protein